MKERLAAFFLFSASSLLISYASQERPHFGVVFLIAHFRVISWIHLFS